MNVHFDKVESMSTPSNPVTHHTPKVAAKPLGDYRLPLAMRSANWLLEPIGSRLWPLEPAELIRQARARAGLSDFGDLAPLDEPLEVLCRSYNEEVDLNAIGRLVMRRQLIRQMISRLRLTDLTARQPDLFVEPVTAPLFVAGMPRSGTTFLHRTMARDRAWYSMPFWEAMEPIPAVGTLCGSGPDPRVRTGEGILRFTRWVMPEMAGVHEIENDEPEEELSILAAGHASITFGLGYFPAYARWYTTTDHTGGYRLLRQFIQAMQASRPAGGRWLLKCPSHLEMLCPLLTVFNDAKVVLTHRDPISSIVSLAALAYFTVGISFRRPDPHWFGQTSANFIERALHSMVHYRDSDEGIENGDRFIDVAFTELVSNPIGTVHRISLAAGREPDDAALAAMRAYTGRPSGHRSEQRFTVEDFGLDKMALRERFKFYYERFEVPIERG